MVSKRMERNAWTWKKLFAQIWLLVCCHLFLLFILYYFHCAILSLNVQCLNKERIIAKSFLLEELKDESILYKCIKISQILFTKHQVGDVDIYTNCSKFGTDLEDTRLVIDKKKNQNKECLSCWLSQSCDSNKFIINTYPLPQMRTSDTVTSYTVTQSDFKLSSNILYLLHLLRSCLVLSHSMICLVWA